MLFIERYFTELTQLQVNTLVATVAGLITIVVSLFIKLPLKIVEFVAWVLRTLKPGNDSKSAVPRKTVKIVFNESDSWWSLGKSGKGPGMQVVIRCFLTNITDAPSMVLASYLTKPKVHGQFWLSTNDHRGRFSGVIPPKSTVEFSGTFWIHPPSLKDGAMLLNTGLVLVDQFDNKHIMKVLHIRGDAKEKKQSSKNAGESLHAISDPIEKELVAVLKNECARYRDCGRSVGGLGSVMTDHNGQKIIGIGSDTRPSNSPHENSIINGTQINVIRSENATALIDLFQTLSIEELQFKFVSALETRLSKGSEYSCIGYFILLVLFRIGKLKIALIASKKLEGDDEFGFSDFLRLIDGLLRYEQASFDEDDLDEIEKCIDMTTEHSFRIKERVAAIRAYRLRKRAQN